ncbi:hypothetical protein DI53_2699 [Sphingobacterium deserti]|uniref:Uncharacterized protein n=1 Tax=Sphingobacterium deserti TaxID=1229276 RepID=A0A0B8T051_9SPHI|nr:hypothetical protein DI53_2699 [Sphingobacterium deserti]
MVNNRWYFMVSRKWRLAKATTFGMSEDHFTFSVYEKGDERRLYKTSMLINRNKLLWILKMK